MLQDVTFLTESDSSFSHLPIMGPLPGYLRDLPVPVPQIENLQLSEEFKSFK